jgi:hypothetical protein
MDPDRAVVDAVKKAAVSTQPVGHVSQIPEPSLPAKVLALLLGHPSLNTSPKQGYANAAQKQVAEAAASKAKLEPACPPATPLPIPVKSRKVDVSAGRLQKQKAAAPSPGSRGATPGDPMQPLHSGTQVVERLQTLLQPTTPQELKVSYN